MIRFPVEEALGELRRLLAANRPVVLTAPPGSGKTTRAAPALLDEPWLDGKKIVMLEPRRLAARNCAAYMAAQRGESVGGVIGCQVRLERKISAATRLEVVTEGLLAQRLLSDPELDGVGLVVFDEFHERSLQCDLAFAMALEARAALRPDLRLLVMSATLDADEAVAHLGADAAVVRASGRMYPVEKRFLGDVSMVAAVNKALAETDGDILCFLPGEAEIRRCAESLCAGASGGAAALVLPLYGSLQKDEQDRVFRPSDRRKIILATSIAETSLTIEGISCVIDSGLMRRSRFSPATGMSGLVTLPLTRDRAEQRAGRAGRVRSGVCYRLWTESDDMRRQEKQLPEILDADLCPLVLASAVWGATKRDGLPWLTPPPAAAWDQAAALLAELGAIDKDGRPTQRGLDMARLSIHPRLAAMMLATRGDAAAREMAALLAAIVEEGVKTRETDIRRVFDEVRETRSRASSRRVLQLAERIENGCRRVSCGGGNGGAQLRTEGALLACAYPDRVAKNRGNGTFRMVCGRGAFVEREDPLAKSPYVVCCELDDRQGDARLFLGCPIDEDEIASLFADRIEEDSICEWDRINDRVKSVVRRRIGAMTLSEAYSADAADGESQAAAMLEGIRCKGLENMPCWSKEALQLRRRMAFAHRHCDGWPDPTDDAILAVLPPFLAGMAKWRDLERLDPFKVLDSLLAEAGRDRRGLDSLAPQRIEVPTGSRIAIRYDGDEPTLEVRLQECFGMMQTPRIAGGRVPVVMTLLSPAQRPVQVTKDLEGFWRESYALVRKEMRGRYPRHYWPEDPFTAVPTRRVRPPGQAAS